MATRDPSQYSFGFQSKKKGRFRYSLEIVIALTVEPVSIPLRDLGEEPVTPTTIGSYLERSAHFPGIRSLISVCSTFGSIESDFHRTRPEDIDFTSEPEIRPHIEFLTNQILVPFLFSLNEYRDLVSLSQYQLEVI